MTRRRRATEAGAAAVEFALVLVPLLIILLGLIDWGYYFYVRESIINAAREGARAGSINPGAERDRASGYLTAAGLDVTRATISTSCDGVENSACVQIQYEAGSITGFTIIADAIPPYAVARAVMRVEGAP